MPTSANVKHNNMLAFKKKIYGIKSFRCFYKLKFSVNEVILTLHEITRIKQLLHIEKDFT